MTETGEPGEKRPVLRLVVGDTSPDATDAELVEAFVAGDEAVFGTLVHRYQRLVFSLVRRYSASPEESADLSQRAFLRAFAAARRMMPKLRRGKDTLFKAWLARIAVNVGKNHLRDRRRWRMESEGSLSVLEAPEAAASEQLEEAERRRKVREVVLELPRRQREVLTLRVDGDLPFSEVAQALGITENNAKVHFHHAVKRLKALLAGVEGEGV